jgi:hypothetical protein
MNKLMISSALFDNDWMPDECSGYGEDKSPELKSDGIVYN